MEIRTKKKGVLVSSSEKGDVPSHGLSFPLGVFLFKLVLRKKIKMQISVHLEFPSS
jgi:hypothetical protein